MPAPVSSRLWHHLLHFGSPLPSCSCVGLLHSSLLTCFFAALCSCLSVLVAVSLLFLPDSLHPLFSLAVLSGCLFCFMALAPSFVCQLSVCLRGLGIAFYLLLPALISADPTGLTTSPSGGRGRLHCYTCSFAKPCYPVPTECGEDEVCGVSVGTSGRTLVRWPFLGWRLTSLFSARSCHPNLGVPLLSHRAK